MDKFEELNNCLKEMCKHCQRLMAQIPSKAQGGDIHHCGHVMCPWRTISGDYCDDYTKIKEALKEYEDFSEKYVKLLQDYNNLLVSLPKEKRFVND